MKRPCITVGDARIARCGGNGGLTVAAPRTSSHWSPFISGGLSIPCPACAIDLTKRLIAGRHHPPNRSEADDRCEQRSQQNDFRDCTSGSRAGHSKRDAERHARSESPAAPLAASAAARDIDDAYAVDDRQWRQHQRQSERDGKGERPVQSFARWLACRRPWRRETLSAQIAITLRMAV